MIEEGLKGYYEQAVEQNLFEKSKEQIRKENPHLKGDFPVSITRKFRMERGGKKYFFRCEIQEKDVILIPNSLPNEKIESIQGKFKNSEEAQRFFQVDYFKNIIKVSSLDYYKWQGAFADQNFKVNNFAAIIWDKGGPSRLLYQNEEFRFIDWRDNYEEPKERIMFETTECKPFGLHSHSKITSKEMFNIINHYKKETKSEKVTLAKFHLSEKASHPDSIEYLISKFDKPIIECPNSFNKSIISNQTGCIGRNIQSVYKEGITRKMIGYDIEVCNLGYGRLEEQLVKDGIIDRSIKRDELGYES